MPQTMMLVEDEEPCRRAMQMLLRSRGFAVQAVASAEEALALLSSDGFAPAVMIVDVDLPGMCGLDLVERVQSGSPHIRPMLVTAADKRLMERFAADHHVPYFAKPLDIAGFLTCVANGSATRIPQGRQAVKHSATACQRRKQSHATQA